MNRQDNESITTKQANTKLPNDGWKTEQGPVIVKTKKLRAIKKPGVVKFRVFSFAEILFFPGKNDFH